MGGRFPRPADSEVSIKCRFARANRWRVPPLDLGATAGIILGVPRLDELEIRAYNLIVRTSVCPEITPFRKPPLCIRNDGSTDGRS